MVIEFALASRGRRTVTGGRILARPLTALLAGMGFLETTLEYHEFVRRETRHGGRKGIAAPVLDYGMFRTSATYGMGAAARAVCDIR